MVGAPGANAVFVFQIAPINTEAVATFTAPDQAAGDSFGKAVSLSIGGEWIAVGAPHRDEGGTVNKGAVYVFQFASGEWLYHSKITSNIAVTGDRFGWSVSIDDSLSAVRVLVGCNYHVDYSGFVEVFELSSSGAVWTATWSQTIGGHGAMYGYSVSLSGDTLAVGSPSDNFEYKNDQGTLFCYTRNTDGSWSDRGKTGGGAWGRSNSNLKVGWSVSQDGSIQAAGAPAEGSNRGAVYVREVPASPQARGFVVEQDTAAGDLFGSAVALKWPFLAVGAPGHGSDGDAFLYEYNTESTTWIKVGDKMDPAGLGMLQMTSFGTSVALFVNMVLIGGAGSAALHVRTSSTAGESIYHI